MLLYITYIIYVLLYVFQAKGSLEKNCSHRMVSVRS